MAWGQVQKKLSANLTAASSTLTFTTPVTAGNVIQVIVSGNGTAVPTFAVSDGTNTYTSQITATSAGDLNRVQVFTAPCPGGGSPTITVTFTGSGPHWDFEISEWSGTSSSAYKTAATSGSTASPATSGATGATTNPNELAVGAFADSGTTTALSATSPWTGDDFATNNALLDFGSEHQDTGITGSAVNASFTHTGSVSASVVAAIFPLSAGGAAAQIPNVTMAPMRG